MSSIQLFHTDRGSEFDNQLISKLLDTFDIVRSLSAKGCPYDNAVAEATFKSIKTEFVYQETFETIAELQIKWFDYVHSKLDEEEGKLSGLGEALSILKSALCDYREREPQQLIGSHYGNLSRTRK